ncbi:MAG: hypothetical protein ACOX2F_06340 [bacterium]
MKKITLLLLFTLIFSCSSQPAPAWQQESFINMNNFVSSFMEGNEKFAATYYKKFVEHLEMTTDPDEIIKAHLIKCSLDFSLMNYRTCSEASPYLSVLKNKENLVFFNFISSKGSEVPPKYQNIKNSLNRCEPKKTNKAIKKIKEPLSKLIAVSYAVRAGCYDEETIAVAVETASNEGWKKAALEYMTFGIEFFEKNGEYEKGKTFKKRIELLNNND